MMPRWVAGAALAFLTAPVSATCPAWQVCRGAWLWDAALPAVILGGLVIWVAGPIVFAALRLVARGERHGPPDAGGKSAG